MARAATDGGSNIHSKTRRDIVERIDERVEEEPRVPAVTTGSIRFASLSSDHDITSFGRTKCDRREDDDGARGPDDRARKRPLPTSAQAEVHTYRSHHNGNSLKRHEAGRDGAAYLNVMSQASCGRTSNRPVSRSAMLKCRMKKYILVNLRRW